MTSNQIAYRANEETARSNKSREAETARSNRAKERETARSNRANEQLTRRGQNLKFSGDIAKGIGSMGKTIVGLNDPSWYMVDQTAAKQAAGISFLTPLGDSITMTSGQDTQVYKNPLVFALEYNAVLPHTRTEATSGSIVATQISPYVRQSALNTYSFIRQKNSGGKNYEAVDVLMYQLAVTEAYRVYAMGVRAYGTLRKFSMLNRNTPVAVFNAMGFNYTDFCGNQAQLLTYLNIAKARLDTLAVPNTWTYFNRSIWMAGSIFKDSESKKCSIIVPKPLNYYIYQPEEATLKFTRFDYLGDNDLGMTFSMYRKILDNLLEILTTDEDINVISGDILRAFESSVFQIESLDEDYIIEFKYHKDIIHQFHNASVLGTELSEVEANNITQPGAGNLLTQSLEFEPISTPYTFAQVGNAPAFDNLTAFIDLMDDEVSAEDIYEATRLVTLFIGRYRSGSGGQAELTPSIYECNCEIVSRLVSYGIMVDGDIDSTRVELGSLTTMFQNPRNVLNIISIMSRIDWCPYYKLYHIETVTTPYSELAYFPFIGDTSNYAIVFAESIKNLNAIATLSLFGIPYNGTKVR